MTLTEAQREALKNATVAYYSMDDADVSGNTVFDLTPNGNDGTIVGATTGVSGILNEGFSFDGSNDYLDTNNNNGFSSTDTFMISTWINPSSLPSFQVVMSNIRSSNGEFAYSISTSDETVRFTLTRTGVTNQHFSSTNSITTGNWYHISAFYDNGDVELYINGVQEVTGTVTISGSAITSSSLKIGTRGSLLSNYYSGDIDETLLLQDWTSAGTAQEIATYLFNNGNPTRLQQFPYTSTTQAIQGTVTLDGNPVEGADVRLINTTDDIYIGSFTTPADGTYSFTNLLSDKEYHALVQYKDGSNNEYNTLSLPFLSPEEVDDV